MEDIFAADRQPEDFQTVSIRPQGFDDYVGQRKVKENLKIFCSGGQETW